MSTTASIEFGDPPQRPPADSENEPDVMLEEQAPTSQAQLNPPRFFFTERRRSTSPRQPTQSERCYNFEEEKVDFDAARRIGDRAKGKSNSYSALRGSQRGERSTVGPSSYGLDADLEASQHDATVEAESITSGPRSGALSPASCVGLTPALKMWAIMPPTPASVAADPQTKREEVATVREFAVDVQGFLDIRQRLQRLREAATEEIKDTKVPLWSSTPHPLAPRLDQDSPRVARGQFDASEVNLVAERLRAALEINRARREDRQERISSELRMPWGHDKPLSSAKKAAKSIAPLDAERTPAAELFKKADEAKTGFIKRTAAYRAAQEFFELEQPAAHQSTSSTAARKPSRSPPPVPVAVLQREFDAVAKSRYLTIEPRSTFIRTDLVTHRFLGGASS